MYRIYKSLSVFGGIFFESDLSLKLDRSNIINKLFKMLCFINIKKYEIIQKPYTVIDIINNLI